MSKTETTTSPPREGDLQQRNSHKNHKPTTASSCPYLHITSCPVRHERIPDTRPHALQPAEATRLQTLKVAQRSQVGEVRVEAEDFRRTTEEEVASLGDGHGNRSEVRFGNGHALDPSSADRVESQRQFFAVVRGEHQLLQQ